MTKAIYHWVQQKRMREMIFNPKKGPRTYLGLQLWRIPVAIADPIVYPRYTTLPKKPNLVFSIFNSYLILVDPAGKIPISIFTNRFAKNWTNRKIVIHLGLMPDGRIFFSKVILICSGLGSSRYSWTIWLCLDDILPTSSYSPSLILPDSTLKSGSWGLSTPLLPFSSSSISSSLICGPFKFPPVSRTCASPSPWPILGCELMFLWKLSTLKWLIFIFYIFFLWLSSSSGTCPFSALLCISSCFWPLGMFKLNFECIGPNLLVDCSPRPLLFPLFFENMDSLWTSFSYSVTLLPTIPAKLSLLCPKLKLPSRSLGPKFFLKLLLCPVDFLLPLLDLLFALASLLDLDSVFLEVTVNLKDCLILPRTPDLDIDCRSLFGLGVEF